MEHLRSSRKCLQRGMLSCHNRETFMKLCGGAYQLMTSEVFLPSFVASLTEGRCITTSISNITVFLDPTLCQLVLENAISNALKHGDADNANVCFGIWEDESHVHRPSLNAQQQVMLVFRITNRVKRRMSTLAQANPVANLSDRIGLQHMRMAAEAQGMHFDLTFDEVHATFEARMLIRKVVSPTPVYCESPNNCVLDFPSGLRFCCIDDSKVQRMLLQHSIQRSLSPASVRVFGQEPAEVQQFKEAVLDDCDIAILDQNLEFEGGISDLGTDLVAELIAKRSDALFCIRSGNTSAADREVYSCAGAHCALGKELPMKQMFSQIKHAWDAKARKASVTVSERSSFVMVRASQDVPEDLR